jgi:hypothetical protein
METDRQIQKAMQRAGFTAAAEDFPARARFYSPREMLRLERYWLS